MIVAIDPSYDKPVGIAWLKNKTIGSTLIELDKDDKKPETRSLYNIAKKIVKNIELEWGYVDDLLVAIEGQWFGVNPKMTMNLVELRGILEGILNERVETFNSTNKEKKVIKLQIIVVNPHSWQSDILNVGKMKSEEIKKRSIKYASDLKKEKVNEDEADAICILKYAEKQWI